MNLRIGLSLSLICQPTSEDIKQHRKKKKKRGEGEYESKREESGDMKARGGCRGGREIGRGGGYENKRGGGEVEGAYECKGGGWREKRDGGGGAY